MNLAFAEWLRGLDPGVTMPEAAQLAALTSFATFIEQVLRRVPSLTGRELAAGWRTLGHEVTSGEARAVRREVKRARQLRGEPGAELEPATLTLEQVKERMQAALDVDDDRVFARYAMALARLKGALPDTLSAADAGEDWSRLTEAEAECLTALCRKLRAESQTLLGEWFIALLARVPPRERDVHPANVLVPGG